ncbi:unnamed protein product, partial [Ectocarpus sp. 12 AP-2014]
RYSYSEAQLAELITHAATIERQQQQQQQPRQNTKSVCAASFTVNGAGESSAQEPGGKRQRLDARISPGTKAPSERSVSRNAVAGAGVRSPLEAVDERSRADPDWAGMHHRQAWFLQVVVPFGFSKLTDLGCCTSLQKRCVPMSIALFFLSTLPTAVLNRPLPLFHAPLFSGNRPAAHNCL